MKKNLTNREKLFVQEYLVDLDVERAAITAGFSKSMAATKAYTWVRNGKVKPHVFAAIKKAFDKRAVRTEITQDNTLQMVKDIADIDHKDYSDKRTSKGIEMLCRCHGMFTDKFQIGMDEATLNTILNTLPPEQAEKTKAALMAIAKKK